MPSPGMAPKGSLHTKQFLRRLEDPAGTEGIAGVLVGDAMPANAAEPASNRQRASSKLRP